MDTVNSTNTPETNEKESFFSKFAWLFVLAAAIAAFLFLFGNVLTYGIKYVPEGGSKAIKEYFDINLLGLFNSSLTPTWPIIILLVFIGLAGILPIFSLLFKKAKEGLLVSSIIFFLLSICMLFAEKEIFAYFGASMINDFYNAETGWAIAVSVACCSLGALVALSATGYAQKNSVREMAEDGILIAAAFVLNFIKLPINTGGGSINFQMLPLMIIALRHGPVHGLVCGGLIYGILTCLTDGYGFFTYPFDYLVGFGSVAVMGFFSKWILPKGQRTYTLKGEILLFVSGLLATLIRFVGSTVSSMLFFGTSFSEALVYNAIYIPVSGAIAVALIMVLYGPIAAVNDIYPVKR